MTTGRARRRVPTAIAALTLAGGLAGCSDEHGETTCEEMLGYVGLHADDPPTQGYDTVGATLGVLKDRCPAEYETAKEKLDEAGYYR